MTTYPTNDCNLFPFESPVSTLPVLKEKKKHDVMFGFFSQNQQKKRNKIQYERKYAGVPTIERRKDFSPIIRAKPKSQSFVWGKSCD